MVLWKTGKIAVTAASDQQEEKQDAVEKAKESRRRRRQEQAAAQQQPGEMSPTGAYPPQMSPTGAYPPQMQAAQPYSHMNQPQITTVQMAGPQAQAAQQHSQMTHQTMHQSHSEMSQTQVIQPAWRQAQITQQHTQMNQPQVQTIQQTGQMGQSQFQTAQPQSQPQIQTIQLSGTHAQTAQQYSQPNQPVIHTIQRAQPQIQPHAQPQVAVAATTGLPHQTPVASQHVAPTAEPSVPPPQSQAQAPSNEARTVPHFLQRKSAAPSKPSQTAPPWRQGRERPARTEPVPSLAGQVSSMGEPPQAQMSQAPHTPPGEYPAHQTPIQTVNGTEPVVNFVKPAMQPHTPPAVQPVQHMSPMVTHSQPTATPFQPPVNQLPQVGPMQPSGNYYQPQMRPVQPVVNYNQPQVRPVQPATNYMMPTQPVMQYNQPASRPVEQATNLDMYNQPQAMQPSTAPTYGMTQQMTTQPTNFVPKPMTPTTPPAQTMPPTFIPAQEVVAPVHPVVAPGQPMVAPGHPMVAPQQPEPKHVPPVVNRVITTKSRKKSKKSKGGPSEDKLWQDFDESAYLSGKVSLFGNEVKPYQKPEKKKKELAPWEKRRVEEENERHFDEQVYLGQTELIQRAQQRLQEEEEQYVPVDTGEEDFDEKAYLSGQAEVVGMGGSNVPRVAKEKVKELAPWEKDRPKEEDEHFDEDSFLGRKQFMQQRPEEEEGQEDYAEEFDENAFLSGQVRIVGGQGSTIPRVPKEKKKELAPWETRRRPEDAGENFDEDAFLGRTYIQQKEGEEDEDMENRDFDEAAFLQGKMNLLGGEGSTIPRVPKEKVVERVPWERERPEGLAEQFDENAFLGRQVVMEDEDDRDDERINKTFNEAAFLMGKIPLVSGGEVDVTKIQEIEKRQQEMEERRKEQEEMDEQVSACQEDFDEAAYLSGKIGVFGESKEEGFERPQKEESEMVPWQYRQEAAEKRDEFDETSFLYGNVVSKNVRHISEDEVKQPGWMQSSEGGEQLASKFRQRSQNPDSARSDEIVFPSALLGRKARSRSREASQVSTGSAGSGQYDSDQAAGSDEGRIYTGGDIPSKTFSGLDRVTARQEYIRMEREDQMEPDEIANVRARLAHVGRDQSTESSEESDEEDQVTTF